MGNGALAASWWNCDWYYRSQISVSASGAATDYAVHLDLSSTDFDDSYSFTADGSDLRVLGPDGVTELSFFLEHWDAITRRAVVNVSMAELSTTASSIYLYYGNSAGAAVSAVTPASSAVATFVEAGWRIHTRVTSVDPANEAQARAVFDSVDDSTGGYGCAVYSDITGRNNRNTFNGPNGNYGLLNEVYFEVDVPGIWSFRYGGDYGLGGGLYVNSLALDERWNDDLWWAMNFNNPDVLSGSILLDNGYHHIETIGFEGCCDGPIHVQFKRPGSAQWLDMSSANLPLYGRSCPPGSITDSLIDRQSPTFFSGSLYLDNGVGGSAHDGIRSSGESGVEGIAVTATVLSTGSAVTDHTEADGSWKACFLDEADGRDIVIDSQLPADYLAVSENLAAANDSPDIDSVIAFNAAPDTHYADINFGVVERPRLSADRNVTIAAGARELLAHRYTATTTAQVSLQVSQRVDGSQSGFTYLAYRDVNCDGLVEQPAVWLSNPISVVAGENICLVVQVTADQDADQSTTLSLKIDATSALSGIGIVDTVTNIDEVSGDERSELLLRKQVCNDSRTTCEIISGSGFGLYNSGSPGEILQYRIVFSSLNSAVSDINLYDSVPAYTTLAPMSVTLAEQPPGVSCTVVQPGSQNVSGYKGDIEFQCSGSLAPTEAGVVGFSVIID